MILHEWIAFYSAFLNIHWSGVFTMLAWLVPHETAAILAHYVYTMQRCTMSLHVCLAVTCHLHFWQNDQGLLRATAVTQGGGTDTKIPTYLIIHAFIMSLSFKISHHFFKRHSSSWWCTIVPSLVTQGLAIQKISSERRLTEIQTAVTWALNTAIQWWISFHKTLRIMMIMHHTKSGCKLFRK